MISLLNSPTLDIHPFVTRLGKLCTYSANSRQLLEAFGGKTFSCLSLPHPANSTTPSANARIRLTTRLISFALHSGICDRLSFYELPCRISQFASFHLSQGQTSGHANHDNGAHPCQLVVLFLKKLSRAFSVERRVYSYAKSVLTGRRPPISFLLRQDLLVFVIHPWRIIAFSAWHCLHCQRSYHSPRQGRSGRGARIDAP